MTTKAERADELAAPLDTLLIEAGQGTARRLIPNSSTARFVGRLASKPQVTLSRAAGLAQELGKIAVGSSEVTATRRDRRFSDPAWRHNPFLRRMMQAYLAAGTTVEELIGLADLDWRDDRRVRFMLMNLTEAVSPSNVPLVNPASAKAALEYGGLSLVKGAANFVSDMWAPPRIPQMVDVSGFKVGGNIAVTPGAAVLRTEVFELIQYTPQTEHVRTVPLLIVPPTINKYYAMDLAPGRSLIEYLVQQGQQVFVMSWRNPDGRHADWGMSTYVDAVLDAMDATDRVTGSERMVLAGACSGGIIASATAGYLASAERTDRLAGFTLLVTVLDNVKAGDVAAFSNKGLAEAAKRVSRRKGYLDGNRLAEMFAWLRPGDLVWNYWVSNYLCGGKPPAFDILFWNSDTTRMSAQLHADFIDIGLDNLMTRPGALEVKGTGVDLGRVSVDSYVVAGISDHITPWQNCYRSCALLGGESRFVLSTSGHIAALVNPPTNEKATFQLNQKLPEDPDEWLLGASTEPGSWWPDWSAWLADRAGQEKPAPGILGGGGLSPLAEAPGTYVFDK
jgi:polyhydroxyalkanoate synthase subunit PhaC